jgi:hypothetical protein
MEIVRKAVRFTVTVHSKCLNFDWHFLPLGVKVRSWKLVSNISCSIIVATEMLGAYYTRTWGSVCIKNWNIEININMAIRTLYIEIRGHLPEKYVISNIIPMCIPWILVRIHYNKTCWYRTALLIESILPLSIPFKPVTTWNVREFVANIFLINCV